MDEAWSAIRTWHIAATIHHISPTTVKARFRVLKSKHFPPDNYKCAHTSATVFRFGRDSSELAPTPSLQIRPILSGCSTTQSLWTMILGFLYVWRSTGFKPIAWCRGINVWWILNMLQKDISDWISVEQISSKTCLRSSCFSEARFLIAKTSVPIDSLQLRLQDGSHVSTLLLNIPKNLNLSTNIFPSKESRCFQ